MIFTVPCPRCGAAPDEKCTGPRGLIVRPHPRRWDTLRSWTHSKRFTVTVPHGEDFGLPLTPLPAHVSYRNEDLVVVDPDTDSAQNLYWADVKFIEWI